MKICKAKTEHKEIQLCPKNRDFVNSLTKLKGKNFISDNTISARILDIEASDRNAQEYTRKEFLDSEEIREFTNYCEDIRGDWSNFDGRDLLSNWNQTLQALKQSLEEKK